MSKTLFVGGLAFRTTEHDLFHYFQKFGEIDSTTVIKDRLTGASKGYGFVFYHSETAVKDVISKKPHKVRGRLVDCQAAKKKSEKDKYKETLSKTRIFVTCLSPNINNNDMNTFFAKFGAVKSAYIIRDPDTERSMGFGFVIFEKPEDAKKTVKNPYLWLKGTKINCDMYKDNEEGKEECFDPVGKRMRKIKPVREGSNHKMATPVPLNEESLNLDINANLEKKGRVNGSNVANILNSEKKELKGIKLFGYDEEELGKEKKLAMVESFRRIQLSVMKYSHIVGGNVRLNAPYADNKRRRKAKMRQMEQLVNIFIHIENNRNSKNIFHNLIFT